MGPMTLLAHHLPAAVEVAARSRRSGDGVEWGVLVLFAVWAVIIAGCYGLGIWALVDTIRHRDDEFEAVGTSRVLWLVLLLVGLLVCQPMGLVVALIFVIRIRPKVLAW